MGVIIPLVTVVVVAIILIAVVIKKLRKTKRRDGVERGTYIVSKVES